MRVTFNGSHLKEFPGAVQVKVTVSIGHGLSTLTEYCAVKKIGKIYLHNHHNSDLRKVV